MSKESEAVKDLVDRIVADGKITKDEQRTLNDLLMEDGKIDDEENKQIKRIMQLMNDGAIKLVD